MKSSSTLSVARSCSLGVFVMTALPSRGEVMTANRRKTIRVIRKRFRDTQACRCLGAGENGRAVFHGGEVG